MCVGRRAEIKHVPHGTLMSILLAIVVYVSTCNLHSNVLSKHHVIISGVAL